MKVDGKKFKDARLAIKNSPMMVHERKEIYDGKYSNEPKKTNAKKGPKRGTQAWLSDESGIDLRLIQSLEAGTASQNTVEAVSPFLKINGYQYMFGHGESHIKCGANKYVDFRPLTCPDPTGSYLDSNLMVTIDPLFIKFLDIDLDSVSLNEITASIDFLGCNLSWWSFVNISPSSSDWLGQIEETNHVLIDDYDIKLWSIMFKQESIPNLPWVDFVKKIESSTVEYFDIKISLDFSYFKKEFIIKINRKAIEDNFNVSRKKYNSNYPYRVQVRPLVLT